jgi:dihydrofolate reductase
MKVSLVAAVAENKVIGKNNDLPWSLPDDMKYFMNKTKGHHVILGRKNYESLPEKFRPLPERNNVVVTRQKQFHAPGCTVVHSFEDAMAVARNNGEHEVMVIGGADIYELALPYADRLYLTEIKASVEGDIHFPEYDKDQWREISRIPHNKDDRHAYAFDFVLYERVNG